MNRIKSILLAATALAALSATPQANAQTVDATGVTFLAPPPAASGNADIFPDSIILSRGITADGTTVLTSASTPSGSPNESIRNLNQNIFLWTNGTMRTIAVAHPSPAIGRGNGYSSTGMSGDGNTIIGSRSVIANRLGGGTSGYTAATVWTEATGLRFFASPSANEFVAFAQANMDGSLFAVTVRPTPLLADSSSNPARFGPRTVFRYSPSGGFQSLGSLGASISMTSQAISGAGDIIAGGSTDLAASNLDANGDPINHGAWRWSAASGLGSLPDLVASPLNGTVARNTSVGGISRDGSTIVGSSIGSDGRRQAVYWRGGTITGLGLLSGFAAPAVGDFGTQASAASADGRVIIGTAGTGTSNFVGWHWTAATGMQDLNMLARNAGLNLNGFVLADTTGISDNGQLITGNAIKGGFDPLGLPLIGQGYVLSIAAAPPVPTTFETTSRLIITLRLPGVTQTSIVNQTFSTQVDATLNGTTVFTRTVGAVIDSTAGTTALTDARTALQLVAGLRRVTIAAPTMVSNVTTVLGMTSTTTDVPSGTQVTTASVTTPGAATVATGNLGTCATPAATNVNPTGCSLPGATVAVGSNEININNFTNTINSVTPTTTRTVDQLVTARWLVAATAGNQFGTVHALVGPAAFERGDRLIGQLIGLRGNAYGGRANGLTRAALPTRRTMALGEGGAGDSGSGLTMFGGYFGNRSTIDADAAVPVARTRGSTDGFVIGLEQALGDAARIGVAVDHGTSTIDVRDPAFPEALTLNQTQIAAFGGWASGGFSLDAAASHGFGSARTSIATPGGPASPRRDSRSWGVGAQAGYAVPLGSSASVAFVTGVRHVAARLDSFSETGGSSPLTGIASTVDRTRLYGGIEGQARLTLGDVAITPRLHARVASDSGDISGVANVVFASAPNGPVLQPVGPGVGRTVAEVGGSIAVDVTDDVSLWLGYDGQLRDGAKGHTARAGASLRF